MKEPFSFVVESSGERLDTCLAKLTEESRVFVKSQIEKGLVYIDAKPVKKPSYRVKVGQQLSGQFEPDPPLDLAATYGPLDILFEDETLLIVNKPQGLTVHPAPGHLNDTLVNHVMYYLKDNPYFQSPPDVRPGIVHRLDLGTSGVLVLAKNRRAQEHLSKQFRNRTVEKEYECVVWGATPRAGTIDSAIGRHATHRKKMSSKTGKARTALTRWKLLKGHGVFSHLRLYPHTGRTHQLRVHLSETGHPIVGDALYATRAAQGLKNKLSEEFSGFLKLSPHPFLHAAQIRIQHPETGKTDLFKAPRPERFENLLTLIEKFDKK